MARLPGNLESKVVVVVVEVVIYVPETFRRV